jgi:hypothetical protein
MCSKKNTIPSLTSRSQKRNHSQAAAQATEPCLQQMASKRDRGDELAADSVHTLRHVKRLQVQVEKDIGAKKLTPKELGYEDVRFTRRPLCSLTAVTAHCAQ